ncbi:MAG: hypothetical protein R3F08_17360 [Dokdonella sp.]
MAAAAGELVELTEMNGFAIAKPSAYRSYTDTRGKSLMIAAFHNFAKRVAQPLAVTMIIASSTVFAASG